MAKMKNPYAQCPFYQHEEGLRLCCSYGDKKVPSVKLDYTSKQLRLEYEKRFCKRRWEDCPFAKALCEVANNG